MKLVLALLAGFLTTLSPCVLPVLPFVTASSLNKNKLGPAWLACGLLVSFVGVSLLISSTGYIFGIDQGALRKVAGTLLALSGLLFLSQRLSDAFATKLSFLSNRASQTSPEGSRLSGAAEFLNGALLGVVWTPCSGPSLGAALGLAAQEGSFLKAGGILSCFGIGAITPLMAFAYGTKGLVGKIKSSSGAIYVIKKIFGVLIVAFGVSIVFDWDRSFEAALTNVLPDAWLSFVTKF
jgi:cytochrome c biogenesis protein CcdA